MFIWIRERKLNKFNMACHKVVNVVVCVGMTCYLVVYTLYSTLWHLTWVFLTSILKFFSKLQFSQLCFDTFNRFILTRKVLVHVVFIHNINVLSTNFFHAFVDPSSTFPACEVQKNTFSFIFWTRLQFWSISFLIHILYSWWCQKHYHITFSIEIKYIFTNIILFENYGTFMVYP